MTMLMPRIAARVFNAPLGIDPGKAAAFLSGLGMRVVGENLTLEAFPAAVDHMAGQHRLSGGVVGGPLDRNLTGQGIRPYSVHQGVAVIPIEGTLVHKGAYVGQSSGETSYEGLQAQIAMVSRDASIRGVVFEVDSYGGEVAGVAQTGAMMHALSAQKPTMSILTDHACSCGYWLASAARQVVSPATGLSGSIGAIIVHMDVSRAADAQGVTATLIKAGDHKGAGHPLTPLADDARARMQARVDEARDLMAETVGRYRGRRFDKAAALATEAAVFTGAEALRLGLIDAIADPNDAFAAFVAAVNRN